MKDFDLWNGLKKQLDAKEVKFNCDVREIWWCAVGENVGEETSGKNDNFERPVLILKKFSKNNFLVLPITSAVRDGSYFYTLELGGKERSLMLHQARFVSKKRFLRRIEILSENKFNLIQKKYKELYQIESPSFDGLSRAPYGEDTLNISDRSQMSSEERRKKNIVVLVGRSGSGKGTQGELVKQYMENCGQDGMCLNTVYYISTGARFREFVSRDTYTSAISRKVNETGGLQPEFLAVWNWSSILIDYIQDEGNIIFDGAPRKLHEAEVLDSAINFYGWHRPLVLEIDVDLEECVKRMLLRKRADDTEQVIRERLSWYDRDVMPMLEWYKHNPAYNYHKINGNRTVDEIWADIKKVLEGNL